MTRRPFFVVGLLLTAFVAASNAQKAYRCGPDGNIYQQTPCAQGEAVDVDDQRSAQQQRDADSIAKHDARLAAQLERERREREAAVVPATATGINGQPMSVAASTPSSGKHKSKKNSKRKKTGTEPLIVRVPKPAKQ